MKYVFATIWVLLVIAACLLIISAPAFGEDHSVGTGIINHISQMDKIEFLLWGIGLLMLAIGGLNAILGKIMWKAFDRNGKEHEAMAKAATDMCAALTLRHEHDSHEQWGAITELREVLGPLKGQHEAAFSLKGCAYEPQALENTMRPIMEKLMHETLVNLLGERDPKTRERLSDHIPPPYTGKHETPDGVGGD